MRVLFNTWDMAGHLNPMIPLGWALRAAGHEVVVASSPGLVPSITRGGLPALAVGPDFNSFAVLVEQVKASGWQPRRPVDRTSPAPDAVDRIRRRSLLGLRIAAQAAQAQAPDLVEFSRRWRPDLVVFEPSGFAGALVARLLGVPAVRHLWGVDITAPVGQFERDVIGDLADGFGLDELGITGDITVDPCPARVQIGDDLDRQPVRFVPYNGPSIMPPWLREPPAAPRICVTWGTSMDQWGLSHLVLAPLVVEALAGKEVEIVVAAADSQRELFGPLPGNVRFLGRVPLHLLLSTCAGIVHQGGAGTTMTALLDGVPQVVIPHVPDCVFHARQVGYSGAGRYLHGMDATAEAIRANVRAILDDPAYERTAAEIRADMLGAPTPLEVVGILEKLAASRSDSGR
jgi:UDP:flavonoid glycosyltransferase YjiC (YdhE family)